MQVRASHLVIALMLSLTVTALAAEPAVDPGFEVAAGWEPVTHARVDAEGVRVERFGPAEGTVYFTVLNEGVEPVSCHFRIDFAGLGVSEFAQMTELLSGKTGMGGRALLHLRPGDLLVFAQEVGQ